MEAEIRSFMRPMESLRRLRRKRPVAVISTKLIQGTHRSSKYTTATSPFSAVTIADSNPKRATAVDTFCSGRLGEARIHHNT